MSIKGIDKEQFGQLLRQFVSPSDPIESFGQLVGRERQRESIEEALTLPGRHIFICGDRGAGKTSLAHTIAFEHNSSANSPIFVACGTTTTFVSIVKDVVTQLINRSRLVGRETTVGVSGAILGATATSGYKEAERSPETMDLNAATGILIEAAKGREGRTVVVIDEFENLPIAEDRKLFAELVKQLSDRRVPLTLIFCGIGASLDDLLHGHTSAHRYLQEVKLPTPPLTFGGCWEIVDTASSALGLTVNDDSRLRIAQVSDGFPHYVHLICEKLFWIALRCEEEVDELNPEHYIQAVKNALAGVETRLRDIYDHAVKKENDEYQQILWAVADHFELERNNKSIYVNSYERIMSDLGKVPLSFERFSENLSALKNKKHAAILRSTRSGWIRFSENLVRGYVRLVAESQGVRLALEHEPSPDPKEKWMSKGKLGRSAVFPLPFHPTHNV